MRRPRFKPYRCESLWWLDKLPWDTVYAEYARVARRGRLLDEDEGPRLHLLVEGLAQPIPRRRKRKYWTAPNWAKAQLERTGQKVDPQHFMRKLRQLDAAARRLLPESAVPRKTKLTPDVKKAILQRFAELWKQTGCGTDGIKLEDSTYRHLAREFNLHHGVVGRICKPLKVQLIEQEANQLEELLQQRASEPIADDW